MDHYNTEDAIFALATAWAKSAIAVVRVSGQGCIGTLSRAVKGRTGERLNSTGTNRVVYCRLFNPKDGSDVDDVVVTVYRDGHGYTGEEAFEISCHGGLTVVTAVLQLMSDLGFRQALPGEFTLRAFLHGKMDLTRSEAVNELVNAQGRKGQLMALNRLNGALYRRIGQIKDIVAEIMSIVEVQLDYSEDEIGEDLTFPMDRLQKAIDDLGTIHDSYNAGRLYSQGARMVLAGPSNAGKSSLFNYFLKEERSIVSAQKGTTRDYIEAMCTIRGIPVRIFDTAGFRDLSESEIEEEGIRRSRSLVESADIILYLADSTDPSEIDRSVVHDPRCIPILNKVDLNDTDLEGFLKLSVATGQGFNELCDRICGKLTSDIAQADDGSLVIENERQREDLARAMASLRSAKLAADSGLPLDIVSMDIQEALEALGELTGEVTTDDILDRIFSSFCVGK
ncbi:MAG: tRNA uridine-5-carboxymethylaminomethyl(34) synthesis GTPase MnmE [Spirochaetales bacterium]|nr:tRNA uridine-5-carboxymethylaminomethyl(34) synthesis GTPase MnmE [Spirochaetales bacterium]